MERLIKMNKKLLCSQDGMGYQTTQSMSQLINQVINKWTNEWMHQSASQSINQSPVVIQPSPSLEEPFSGHHRHCVVTSFLLQTICIIFTLLQSDTEVRNSFSLLLARRKTLWLQRSTFCCHIHWSCQIHWCCHLNKQISINHSKNGFIATF